MFTRKSLESKSVLHTVLWRSIPKNIADSWKSVKAAAMVEGIPTQWRQNSFTGCVVTTATATPVPKFFSWLIPTPTLSYVIQLRKFKWPMVFDHLHDHHHHGQNSNARAVSHSCASSSPSKIILVTGNKFLGLGQPRSVSHRGARLLWWRWRFTCRWKTAEFFFFKFSFFC